MSQVDAWQLQNAHGVKNATLTVTWDYDYNDDYHYDYASASVKNDALMVSQWCLSGVK